MGNKILAILSKAGTAIFVGGVALIGSLITALAQIGEGAAFSEINTLAWLSAALAGLLGFGGVLGITSRQS